MNDDSGDPKIDEPTSLKAAVQPVSSNDDQRPHPLDVHEDDWSPPSNTWFTVRNALASMTTLVVSTVLAIGVGLPNSAGAMLGVWVATFVLFGPLWFALFNQDFAARFSSSQVEEDGVQEEAAQPAHGWEAALASEPSNPIVNRDAEAPSANPFAAPSAEGSGGDASAAAVSGGPMSTEATSNEQGVARPNVSPLISYYQPQERQGVRRGQSISSVGYAVIVVFATFVGLLVIGGPFLAAVIMWAFGES